MPIEGFGSEVIPTLAILVGIIVIMLTVFLKKFFGERNDTQVIEHIGDALEPPAIYNTQGCPICLDPQILAVETNCGHLFCGACLRLYYESLRETHGFPCALCRQTVRILFLCFTQAEREQEQIARERETTMEFVSYYNRAMSNNLTLWNRICEAPVLLRHLFLEARDEFSEMPLVLRARIFALIIGTLLYVVSPYDFIPEMSFGIFGLVEDLFVVIFIILYLTSIYRHFIQTL